MFGYSYDVSRRRPRWFAATAILIFALLTCLLASGCRKSATDDPPGGTKEESAGRLIDIGGQPGLEMSPDSLKLAGVTTAEVAVQDLGQQVEPTGQIAATDSDTVQITSRLPGRVTQALVSVGSRVHRGQLIALVDSVDLAQAEATYQTAVAHKTLTYNQLEQQRKLAKYGALSEPAIEDAKKTMAAAEAAEAGDQAQLKIDRITVENTRKLVDMGEITSKPEEDAENVEAQASSSLAQSRLSLQSAKANLRRARILYDGGVYSKQQLQDAQTAHDTAVAAVTQNETQEKLASAELKRQKTISKQDLNGSLSLQQAQSKLQQDQHAYQSDLTALELARTQLARAQTVRKSGIPISQSLQQSEDAYAEANAAVQGAASTLKLYGVVPGQATSGGRAIVPVVSPINGVITQRSMVVGQMTDISTPLAKVVNLDRVYVDAQVYEKDLNSVKAGDPVQLRVESFPQKTFNGKVNNVGNEVNPDTRTITVRTIIQNPGWLLRPGMFATMLIRNSTGTRVPTIPSDAVVQEGTRQIVYVQSSPRRFVRREVKVGSAVGGRAPVASGLNPHEKVVVTGNVLIQHEQEKLEEQRRPS